MKPNTPRSARRANRAEPGPVAMTQGSLRAERRSASEQKCADCRECAVLFSTGSAGVVVVCPDDTVLLSPERKWADTRGACKVVASDRLETEEPKSRRSHRCRPGRFCEFTPGHRAAPLLPGPDAAVVGTVPISCARAGREA